MYRAHGLGRVTKPVAPPRPPPKSTRGLSDHTRHSILRFLRLGWTYQAIADKEGCSRHAVKNVFDNLDHHGALRKPPQHALGRQSKISPPDGEALFEHLIRCGWLYQEEIVHWLAMERGVTCSKTAVSRYLTKQGWTAKTLRPFCILRNETLRDSYRRTMRQFAAEDLVFLDESIFNEKTGWRHKAYGPIGEPSRYTQDIRRGKTHAILPAYTVGGYLPCTGVKEGYFSHEDFMSWITERLLPTIRRIYGQRTMVIILDNVSIHTNAAVAAVIEEAGYVVRYLPPYSPDYNPIELTFGVLKAYIKRNFVWTRENFTTFGEYLINAISVSRCDQFAMKHFKYAAGGLYVLQDELDEAHRQIRNMYAGN